MNQEQRINQLEKRVAFLEKSAAAATATDITDPFHFFEQNGFGIISGHMSQKISAWCDQYSDSLVLKAMELAVDRKAKSWRYIENILTSWDDKENQFCLIK
jgi:DnaD/phage-associated family protein